MYEVVNMRFKVDTHCHTIASGHAYSTIVENAQEAAKRSQDDCYNRSWTSFSRGPLSLFWQYGCYTKAD